jgi:hypothetical protein
MVPDVAKLPTEKLPMVTPLKKKQKHHSHFAQRQCRAHFEGDEFNNGWAELPL